LMFNLLLTIFFYSRKTSHRQHIKVVVTTG